MHQGFYQLNIEAPQPHSLQSQHLFVFDLPQRTPAPLLSSFEYPPRSALPKERHELSALFQCPSPLPIHGGFHQNRPRIKPQSEAFLLGQEEFQQDRISQERYYPPTSRAHPEEHERSQNSGYRKPS